MESTKKSQFFCFCQCAFLVSDIHSNQRFVDRGGFFEFIFCGVYNEQCMETFYRAGRFSAGDVYGSMVVCWFAGIFGAADCWGDSMGKVTFENQISF